jgi:transposase
MAFVMVLSWSRQIFLCFYLNQRMDNFLRGHVAAFNACGGVPRVLLYDNLRSSALLSFCFSRLRILKSEMAFWSKYINVSIGT